MLAYRHLFHAGNFADVFKHALLVRLLLALARKEKPCCYIETHAGTGLYDLSHPWAQKNAEHRAGIGRVRARKDPPALLEPYLAAVRAENPDTHGRYYPGSPRLAQRLLRPHDRIELAELNREDAGRLARLFEDDRRVHVQCADGYGFLKSRVPPAERRGLVLADSSFDRAGELERVAAALKEAHGRWATGIYAVWYPLMQPLAMRAFERTLVASGMRKLLQAEFSVRGEDWTLSLRGAGLVVLNPPFGFDAEAREILAWLHPVLAQDAPPAPRVRWLVPE